MPDFNNLEDLNKYLQGKIDNYLDKEVSQVVKAQEQVEIQKVVYDAYPNPIVYKRRGYDEGLKDDEKMNHTVENGTLIVSNDAPLNTEYGTDDLEMSLSDRIEKGTGYMYPYGVTTGYPYMQPRDFIGATVEALENDDTCVLTLKYGLEHEGIKTE
jgi:hypothetical protein